jgi:hypothetical protein
MSANALLLGRRGDVGHENGGGHAQPMRGIGHRHAVIAAGSRHDAGGRRLSQQQIGERAARLEGAGMLKEFELEGEGARRKAEVGHVGCHERRSLDIGPDDDLGGFDAFARDRYWFCHEGLISLCTSLT